MKFSHFIWDYDGTLVDTYPIMTNVLQKILEDRGVIVQSIFIEKHLKISMSYAVEYYRQLYQFDDTFVYQYYRQLEIEEERQAAPFQEVGEVLREIYEGKGCNYLFTHRGDSGMSILHRFGLFAYFSDFITSSNGFARKPSPEGILYLIDKYNIPRKKVIMVGDRDMDVMSAVNAGVASCFVGRAGETNTYAVYSVSDLRQLMSKIE